MLIENKVNKMLIKIIFICFWNLVLKLGLMHKKYLLKLLKFYIWIINDYDSNNNDKGDNNNNESYEEENDNDNYDINELKEMFQNRDESELRDALRRSNGNFDQAANLLLND